MRVIISIFFILTVTFSVSQTKTSDVKVILDVDQVFNKVTIKLKTVTDSASNCKIQIVDSKQTIVKTADLPTATKQVESCIAFSDLGPGNYTCFVYNGKSQLFKQEFSTDAFFMEPHTQPAVRKSQN